MFAFLLSCFSSQTLAAPLSHPLLLVGLGWAAGSFDGGRNVYLDFKHPFFSPEELSAGLTAGLGPPRAVVL